MNTFLTRIHPEFRPKFWQVNRHNSVTCDNVQSLTYYLGIYHAIRGGHADLDKHLQRLDNLLISASQPPDDMDIGQAIMKVAGWH